MAASAADDGSVDRDPLHPPGQLLEEAERHGRLARVTPPPRRRTRCSPCLDSNHRPASCAHPPVLRPGVRRAWVARTFGIEEEFLLVDPCANGRVSPSAPPPSCVQVPAGHPTWCTTSCSSTWWRRGPEPCHPPVPRPVQHTVEARRLLGRAAREVGVAAIATGTAPFAVDDVEIAPKARYRDMVAEFGAIGRTPAPAACTSTSGSSRARRAWA